MNEDRIIFMSTHQIRDLENMIDQVIIVDDGKLLLHSSINNIADKVCFKTVSEMPKGVKVLYSEKMLRGISVIVENTNREDSALNLEHFFNGVTENPAMAMQLFPTN